MYEKTKQHHLTIQTKIAICDSTSLDLVNLCRGNLETESSTTMYEKMTDIFPS